MEVELKDGDVITIQTSIGAFYVRMTNTNEIWLTSDSKRVTVTPLAENRIAISNKDTRLM